MIGVGVLYSTKDTVVLRNFLLACAVADVGHLYVTYHVIGYHGFVNFLNWNPTAWGNIGVTAVLLVVRVLYLVGAFGQDNVVDNTNKDTKGN